MNENVLLIYNDVEDPAGNENTLWQQSCAGVLAEVKAVSEAMDKLGVTYRLESIKKFEQLPAILNRCPEKIIFNLAEEFPDNIADACFVPIVCKAFGRACCGNGTEALLASQDKGKAKAILTAAGVMCPDGIVVKPGEKIAASKLKAGRYFVKPLFSDASEGIDADSVVKVPGASLQKKIKKIHDQLGQPAVVEQFIAERELNVSVLEHNGKAEVIAIAEIDFSAFEKDQPRIVDYSAKWHPDSFGFNNTPRVLPAPISKRAAKLVEKYALAAWETIGCVDYARVDFRMDGEENPFVLEVNPNPDISPDAGFAAAVEFAGLAYEDFIRIVLENAAGRLSITQNKKARKL